MWWWDGDADFAAALAERPRREGVDLLDDGWGVPLAIWAREREGGVGTKEVKRDPHARPVEAARILTQLVNARHITSYLG